MKRSRLTIVAAAGLAAAGIAAAGLAYADDDECTVPISDWQPRDAVEAIAKERGWTLRRIKIDDGCYELKARDAEGREIEATLDPGTLAIIEIEHDDDDDRHGDDRHRGDRGDDSGHRGSAPAATSAPPENGLFNGQGRPRAVIQ